MRTRTAVIIVITTGLFTLLGAITWAPEIGGLTREGVATLTGLLGTVVGAVLAGVVSLVSFLSRRRS